MRLNSHNTKRYGVWCIVLMFCLMLSSLVHAEGESGSSSSSASNNGSSGNQSGSGNNGSCKDCCCDKKKKDKGMEVAMLLFGVAAIVEATGRMAVAGIQANADKTIAGIYSGTQLAMVGVTAASSKYMADQARDIAYAQTATQLRISEENNRGVTDRLSMQLVELRSAREAALDMEREKRVAEENYNRQRIELANQQATDSKALAQATLNAQLVQAGLSQGFSTSSINVSRVPVSGTTMVSPSTRLLKSVAARGSVVAVNTASKAQLREGR